MTPNLSLHKDRASAIAQTLAASPIMRELAEVAGDALAAGLPADAVRARVQEHADRHGLAAWRFLLPGINRKVLRYPFPKFLIEAGKYYAKGTRHRSIKDFIEAFTSRIGWDEWLVDNAISLAKSGEPIPVLSSLFGGVHVQRMTLGDESSDVVMVVAGPASDFEALADELLATCARVYPAESWQRSTTELRDARWSRAFLEGKPDAEIAWDELAVLHPREIVHENPDFADEHKRKTQQVKQARKRFTDRVTKMLDSSSPDSETS